MIRQPTTIRTTADSTRDRIAPACGFATNTGTSAGTSSITSPPSSQVARLSIAVECGNRSMIEGTSVPTSPALGFPTTNDLPLSAALLLRASSKPTWLRTEVINSWKSGTR